MANYDDLASILSAMSAGDQGGNLAEDPMYQTGQNIQGMKLYNPKKSNLANILVGVTQGGLSGLSNSFGHQAADAKGAQDYQDLAQLLSAPEGGQADVVQQHPALAPYAAQMEIDKLRQKSASDKIDDEVKIEAVKKALDNPYSPTSQAILKKYGLLDAQAAAPKEKISVAAETAPSAPSGEDIFNPRSVDDLEAKRYADLVTGADPSTRGIGMPESKASDASRAWANDQRKVARSTLGDLADERARASNIEQALQYAKEGVEKAGRTGPSWLDSAASAYERTASWLPFDTEADVNVAGDTALDTAANFGMKAGRIIGTGSLSTQESQWLRDSAPGKDKTPEANQMFIRHYEAALKKSREYQDFMNYYIDKYGNTTEGQRVWDAYSEEHPIFDPATKQINTNRPSVFEFMQSKIGKPLRGGSKTSTPTGNKPSLTEEERAYKEAYKKKLLAQRGQ